MSFSKLRLIESLKADEYFVTTTKIFENKIAIGKNKSI